MPQLRLGDDDRAGSLTLGGQRRPSAFGRTLAEPGDLSDGASITAVPAGGLTLTVVEARGRSGGGDGGGGNRGFIPNRTQIA
jgi:hypothetical protein